MLRRLEGQSTGELRDHRCPSIRPLRERGLLGTNGRC
jgi:hypothetical protein